MAEKGLSWGNQKEVEELRVKVKAAVRTSISLVDVVHAMLHRRILPLQARTAPMWRHKPKDEGVIQGFFRGVNLDGMWKLLCKPKSNTFPSQAEDIGLSRDNPMVKVTFYLSLIY